MNSLVIVTSNFSSFIASLKSNLKLGYGICQSTEYTNGFYKATLCQGKDEAYISKLKGITGTEKENTLDLLSYLGGVTSPVVVTEEAVTKPFHPDITIKRQRKQRTKKGE
jgi:hypothetical protein